MYSYGDWSMINIGYFSRKHFSQKRILTSLLSSFFPFHFAFLFFTHPPMHFKIVWKFLESSWVSQCSWKRWNFCLLARRLLCFPCLSKCDGLGKTKNETPSCNKWMLIELLSIKERFLELKARLKSNQPSSIYIQIAFQCCSLRWNLLFALCHNHTH